MIQKIVDNLEVTIKNIHIKFENVQNKKIAYSFGFTLDKI